LERLILPSATGSQFQSLTLWEPAQASTVALGSGEAFMIYLKAALLTGTIVAGPFIFYFLWTFVAAGLYPQEQRYVYFYLPFSLSLFAAGVLVAFVFAFEPVLNFLFSFNMMLGIDPQPRIGEWLSFVMLLPLGFGIAFQLPLVMLLLYRIGVISVETYISQWRMAILIIAVISMLATPADPISMLLLGGPLIVLYLFGILLCRFLPTHRRVFAEGYDPA
jgi:sec-independent protein translocase protein TatC